MTGHVLKHRRNTLGDWLIFFTVIIVSPAILSVPLLVVEMQNGNKIAALIVLRYVIPFIIPFVSGLCALTVGLWGLLLLRNLVTTRHNLKVITQIVNSKVTYPFPGVRFYKRVEGIYHGRKIIVSLYPFVLDFSDREESNIYFASLRTPVNIKDRYTAKVSQHCYVRDGNIYYTSGGSKYYFRFVERKYNFREMKEIFEELVRVAQVLEGG